MHASTGMRRHLHACMMHARTQANLNMSTNIIKHYRDLTGVHALEGIYTIINE